MKDVVNPYLYFFFKIWQQYNKIILVQSTPTFMRDRNLVFNFSAKKVFNHIGKNLRHGLRTPNEAVFHWNPELLGLGRKIGQINSGAFGVFSAECFPLFNNYFYKKLSIYTYQHIQIFIWYWDLNLGRKELGI